MHICVQQVTGPTSFSGLENMLGEASNRAGNFTAVDQESRDKSRKPSLLGRLSLAGKGSKHNALGGSVSANDLQSALASSFGMRAAAKANSVIKRK